MKQFKRILSLALVFAMVLSWMCVGPIFANAAASDYISTSYAANLSVKTTQTVSLMQSPTTSATAKYTLPANTMLTVKALHKNTSGTYWYEVLYYNMTLYIDATATTLVDHLTGDVTIANVQSPASLSYGDSFPIQGDISATLNDLGTVTAAMYTSSNITKAPYMIASDEANGKSYSLYGSTVDANMAFGSLARGVYTYVVTAEAISYYIDDNDALATSAQTVVLETQQCVVTDWTNPNPTLAFGIDISEHNGSINWAAAKNDIDYVILRIGWEYTLDDYFLYNVQQVIANDIPYGVYIYSYAETAAEALGEANFVINTLKTYDLHPDLPIWFDFEDPLQVNLSYSLQATIVKTFCTTVSDAGYQPGLYTFKWIMTGALTDSYFDTLPIWIAQVDNYSANGTSTYTGGLWQWQFSWEGVISGINNAVDCNYYYAEFGDYSSDTSYLSKCTYYPARSLGTTTTSVTLRQYPSTSYTSLGTISSGTQVEITGLYKNASGEYWYQVVSGSSAGYISASYVTIDEFKYDDLAVISPAMASNLSVGGSYSLSGTLVSQWNNIYTTHAKIYSGEDTLADPVISSNDTNNSKSYNLTGSDVCDNLLFGNLSAGYYTYEISADVKNYYVSSGSLTSTTENVVVWTAPFTVGSASIEPPAAVACDHNAVTDAAVAPGCTTTGLTAGSHCSKCGLVITAQTVVPATGHTYKATSTSASCEEYAVYTMTCTTCGDSYSVSAETLASQWIEKIPEGLDASLFTSKTQYRYSDYETINSYEPSLDGYTLKSSAWEQSGTGTVNYVNSWPSGFSTSSSLYTQYNNKSSKVSASETTTTKTEVNSDEVVGYLYYHWCYAGYQYSVSTQQGSYTRFHAFYSTTAPSNYACDTSDNSYNVTDSTTCSDCTWYFYTDVYAQKYTTYNKLFTYEGWSDYSDWGDTAVTASSTRKVETRTVYQLKEALPGNHAWSNGKCSVCGATCTHSWVSGVCTICGISCAHNWSDNACTICGSTCSHSWVNGACSICGTVCEHSYSDGVCVICGENSPISGYYLFGYINNADYACEGDYENIGEYRFVDGQLVTSFETNSYVAVKTGDNLNWYMTNGWLGTDVTSATLYPSSSLSTADKLYVPGGVEITFTLVDNGDNTLTLSYEVTKILEIPTISPKYPTLVFEDVVFLNVYFTPSDLSCVKEMGLLTWSIAPTTGTIDNAGAVIPGYVYESESGLYRVRTEGIPAKKMSDTVYFKIYLQLTDGSYVYTNLLNYSPKTFANNILNTAGYSTKAKALVVAMLNYGAAAQTHFGYRPYDLMNSSLTSTQKALVEDYRADMLSGVVSADSSKAGIFTNTGGFSKMYPSISFEGAFSINYYFTPTYAPEGDLTLYYWNQADYNSATTLTTSNATGSIVMTGETELWAAVEGIAAKELDSTVYVAASYNYGGTRYCTGILAYSIGAYCTSQAAGTGTIQSLAAATAVHCYYAKLYFFE